jgi:RecA-family ATPase
MAYDLQYFKNRVRPEPDWIIPNWLKRKNTGFILGEPKKACKSWLMFDLAISLALQKPLWGITYLDGKPLFQASRPMRTVYFTQEDSEDDFHDRALLRFNAGLEDTGDLVWIVPKDLSIGFGERDRKVKLAEELRQVQSKSGPIDLVMFDPMRRMHKGNENDSQVIVDLWNQLDALHADYNCGTLFSHHVVKPPKDATVIMDLTSPYMARGSGDIYGGGDAFINVVPSKSRGGIAGYCPDYRILDLHFESKRSAPVQPSRVKVSFETGKVSFMEFTSAPKDEKKKGKFEVN